MPGDRGHRYDAVPIPSYDEAMADGGPADSESQGLLGSNINGAPSSSSSRRPHGYRAPTVESDDDSLFDGSEFGGDDDETNYVRREMQELEVGDPSHGSRSWTKRIPFSLSLPQWSWRWRLPSIRRPVIRLPSGPGDLPGASASSNDDDNNDENGEPRANRRRCRWPTLPKLSLEGASGRTTALLMARVLAILIVVAFLYIIFVSDVMDTLSRRLGTGLRFNPDDVRNWVQSHIEDKAMGASVRIYSDYAHLAGTEGDYALAMDMRSMFSKAGLDYVHVDEYYAYLNYPKKDGRAVEILDKHGKATWKAQLEEKDPGTETSGRQTFAFHAHSKSGDVQGPLIYANYGSRQDFKRLKDDGIETKGAIALVRYYGNPEEPALKVKAAAEAGFVGCLIYSDPADDGFTQGDAAPNGHFMPKDGVHRSSVSLSNWIVGDPLTPGWGSKEDPPRTKPEQSHGLNQIPSLPLSWLDAQTLLEALKGKGEEAPQEWQGGVPDIDWWTGDASSPVVRLKNEQDEEKKQNIWNVRGKIDGVEQASKSIIIGNPRDALAFGATDPHSGTAVMVEVARIFGILLTKGWRPLRSIEFMSWDGSDYNLIGSTEYVETDFDKVRRRAMAYINLDGAVAGTEFHASGSPVFTDVIRRVLGHIEDPVQNVTLRQLWDDRGAELENLVGTGGDWVAFQDLAGVDSIELDFRGDRYPKHSSYNNLAWVEKVGDPGFIYHGLMAQVVALLVLELADRPIAPLNMHEYTQKMDTWSDELAAWMEETMAGGDKHKQQTVKFAFKDLKTAIKETSAVAKTFDEWERTWESVVMSSGGWETSAMNLQRLGYNNQMAMFNKLLVEGNDVAYGIPDRPQFKHDIFGPEAWPSDKDSFFPIIRAHVESGNLEAATEAIRRTAKRLRDAKALLQSESAEHS